MKHKYKIQITKNTRVNRAIRWTGKFVGLNRGFHTDKLYQPQAGGSSASKVAAGSLYTGSYSANTNTQIQDTNTQIQKHTILAIDY